MNTNEHSSTVVEVTVKVLNDKGLLETVVSAEGKLTKADAGIYDAAGDEQIYVSIQPGADGSYNSAAISVNYHGKLTKADAGLLK